MLEFICITERREGAAPTDSSVPSKSSDYINGGSHGATTPEGHRRKAFK